MLRQTRHFSDPGRAAYFAGLHAEPALIFETTGRVRKRHCIVQGEFAGLVRDDYEAAGNGWGSGHSPNTAVWVTSPLFSRHTWS
jgi:hypothetical protein